MLLSASPAFAHDAPSGWAYDAICCSGVDCRQVEDEAIGITPTGWKVKATGEVFGQHQVRQSKDGHFHRCSVNGLEKSKTLCLYVPDFGS